MLRNNHGTVLLAEFDMVTASCDVIEPETSKRTNHACARDDG